MMGKVCGRPFPSRPGSTLSPNLLSGLLVTGPNRHFPGQGSDFPSVQRGRQLSRIIADAHPLCGILFLTPWNLIMGRPPGRHTGGVSLGTTGEV